MSSLNLEISPRTGKNSTGQSDLQESSRRSLYLPDERVPAGGGYIPSLDGLRAVSIGLVIAAHILPAVIPIPGGLGVTIFFFISGFLITRLLFAEYKETGRLSLPRFYARRFLRLYPVLLVYIGAFVLIAQIHGQGFHPVELNSVLFYFVNYLYAMRDLAGEKLVYPIGTLWSLAVEEHFYLIVPVLLLLLRGRPKLLLCFAATICAACLAIRFSYVRLWPQILGTEFIYLRSETRFDSIAFGVILAVLCELPVGRILIARATSPLWLGFAFGGLFVSLAYRDPVFRETLRYTVQGLSIFVIVATLVFSDKIRIANIVLNASLVVWLGRLSYSLYIWHLGVNAEIVRAFPHPPFIVMPLISLAGMLVLAILSYYLIEQPFLNLRRYLHPKARTVSSPAQSPGTN